MYDRDASLECLLEYMQAVYELLGSADPPQTVALTFRAWLEQVAPLVDYCGNGVRRRATEFIKASLSLNGDAVSVLTEFYFAESRSRGAMWGYHSNVGHVLASVPQARFDLAMKIADERMHTLAHRHTTMVLLENMMVHRNVSLHSLMDLPVLQSLMTSLERDQDVSILASALLVLRILIPYICPYLSTSHLERLVGMILRSFSLAESTAQPGGTEATNAKASWIPAVSSATATGTSVEWTVAPQRQAPTAHELEHLLECNVSLLSLLYCVFPKNTVHLLGTVVHTTGTSIINARRWLHKVPLTPELIMTASAAAELQPGRWKLLTPDEIETRVSTLKYAPESRHLGTLARASSEQVNGARASINKRRHSWSVPPSAYAAFRHGSRHPSTEYNAVSIPPEYVAGAAVEWEEALGARLSMAHSETDREAMVTSSSALPPRQLFERYISLDEITSRDALARRSIPPTQDISREASVQGTAALETKNRVAATETDIPTHNREVAQLYSRLMYEQYLRERHIETIRQLRRELGSREGEEDHVINHSPKETLQPGLETTEVALVRQKVAMEKEATKVQEAYVERYRSVELALQKSVDGQTALRKRIERMLAVTTQKDDEIRQLQQKVAQVESEKAMLEYSMSEKNPVERDGHLQDQLNLLRIELNNRVSDTSMEPVDQLAMRLEEAMDERDQAMAQVERAHSKHIQDENKMTEQALRLTALDTQLKHSEAAVSELQRVLEVVKDRHQVEVGVLNDALGSIQAINTIYTSKIRELQADLEHALRK